jgi:hypothetical protein
VGKYLYENNEATIVAKGFDASNNEQWSKEFAFVGPIVDTISIDSGYHHYTISLDKWGVSDSQTLSADRLWSDRTDGSLPVIYGLGGKVPVVKKPTLVTTTLDGTETTTEYEYTDDGRVTKITDEGRYQVFTYADNGNLMTLTTYDATTNNKTIEDTYQYGGPDNTLLRISEANYSAAITATMDLSVDFSAQKTTALYQFSNGRGIHYEFTSAWKDLKSSTESNGTELCNTGKFTYDRNINPLKHLDYTSFLINNVSINNTLTEDVNFISCAFPTLIPLSYEYKYDDMGYPTEKITHYKGKDGTSTTKYTYREFQQ